MNSQSSLLIAYRNREGLSMPALQTRNVHPRHAQLVADLAEYLADVGRSARWLGIVTDNNARLMDGLIRGQTFPAPVMLKLYTRIVDYLTPLAAAERQAV